MKYCAGMRISGQKTIMSGWGSPGAWQTAYVKYPEKVLGLLKEKKLDISNHNKAIQKCRESRRVSAQDKEMLNALKRKQEEEHGNTRI